MIGLSAKLESDLRILGAKTAAFGRSGRCSLPLEPAFLGIYHTAYGRQTQTSQIELVDRVGGVPSTG
jgi:hypothetical protein